MLLPPPFSARIRGTHRQIDSDFPTTARVGLLHLLFDLVEKRYIDGWAAVARELHRLGRLMPVDYNHSSVSSINQAKKDSEAALDGLKWDRVFDFCERLHTDLAQPVDCYDHNNNFEGTIPKSEVQIFIADSLQRLFVEEELAFEFVDGLVRRRGRRHTVEMASRAQLVLGDIALAGARKHYEKALQFFRSPKLPDYENCVKEAVCAVEAAGKALFPSSKATTLGDLAKWFSHTKEIAIPRSLINTIHSIYAYRSGGEGIGHGGAEGGVATRGTAEFILSVCAAQIILFVDLANKQESDIPF